MMRNITKNTHREVCKIKEINKYTNAKLHKSD